MPVQIPALPPIKSPYSGIGGLLTAIGEGWAQANDPAEKAKLEQQQEALRQEKLKSLTALFQYLPPSQVKDLLPQVYKLLGIGASGPGGTPPIVAPSTGASAEPAAGAPATGVGGPAAPSTKPAPSETGAPPTPDEWLSNYTHGQFTSFADLPPFLKSVYLPQFQLEMQNFDRMERVRDRATNEEDRILAASERGSTAAEVAGLAPNIAAQVDAFNKRYANLGITLDAATVRAGMSDRYRALRSKELQTEYDKYEAKYEASARAGMVSDAADAAAHLQTLASDAQKYLHSNIGTPPSPEDAVQAAMKSPAYREMIIRAKEAALRVQEISTRIQEMEVQMGIARQRLAIARNASNNAALNRAASNARAILSDVRSNLTSLNSDKRNLESIVRAEEVAVGQPKKGADVGKMTDDLNAHRRALARINAAITTATAQQRSIEQQLVSGGRINLVIPPADQVGGVPKPGAWAPPKGSVKMIDPNTNAIYWKTPDGKYYDASGKEQK